MKISDNKINDNINLDVLKRLNYIYRSTISADKTLDYSKKINQLKSLKDHSDILGNAVVEQWLNTKLSEYQIR